MIPAGVRLDLYNATAKLPDEIVVPLIKSTTVEDSANYGDEVVGGPVDTVDVDTRLSVEFKLQRRQPS